jgi:hypothetical protein
VPWNPRDSTLKVRTFQLFTQHRELKPDEYAALIGMRPSCEAWPYLLRQYRNGYLARGRDWRGRLVYRIGRNGAAYLLWWKRQYPDVKVRV